MTDIVRPVHPDPHRCMMRQILPMTNACQPDAHPPACMDVPQRVAALPNVAFRRPQTGAWSSTFASPGFSHTRCECHLFSIHAFRGCHQPSELLSQHSIRLHAEFGTDYGCRSVPAVQLSCLRHARWDRPCSRQCVRPDLWDHDCKSRWPTFPGHFPMPFLDAARDSSQSRRS